MKLSPQFRNLLQSRKGWRWKIVDFFIAFTSLWLSLKLLSDVHSYQPYEHFFTITIYSVVLVVSVRLCGLNTHRLEHLLSPYEIIVSSIQGCTIAFLVVNIAAVVVYHPNLEPNVFALALIFSAASIILIRVGYKWYLQKNPIKVAFLCQNKLTKELSERFKSDPHFEVVCVGSEKPLKIRDNQTSFKNIVITDPDHFVQFLKTNETDFAISVYHKGMSPVVSKVIERLPFSSIDVLNLGAFIELFHREIPLNYRNLHWHTADFFLPKHTITSLVKRIIDFTAALFGLILLLPFFPIIMLLIRMDSPGNPLYSQTRAGLMGKPFKIYKFRTMRKDAESSGAQWAQKKDPRITRIGSFMRKTRIDEIPQLWNILKGDMSLVGPRPERPEFVKDLKESIPLYEWRLLVPPGLTGWAQIRHGYTDTTEGIRRKLQYDLFYIKHHSVWLDLEIILSTIPLMMKGSR